MLYRRSARLRRAFVKGRLVLRRLAQTRSAGAAAQLGKALRADIADLADFISRRAVPHPPSLKWKREASRVGARLRGFKERKWLPYAAGLSLLIAAAALVWILH